VLNANLWAVFGDWPARRGALRRSLESVHPDVVAFQECVVLEGFDQAADLLDGLHLIHQKRRDVNGAGMTIGSRFPIACVDELAFQVAARPGDPFPAGALLTEVAVPPPIGPVLFVNYLPSWQVDEEVERERQAPVLERRIRELIAGRDMHVVIAGDLDADPSCSSIRFWTGRQSLDGMSTSYRDAWEACHPGERGETFTPANPIVVDRDWPYDRIDYVFVRCGLHNGPTLQVERCERWNDAPVDGVWASDHFGVFADLAIPA